MGSALRIGAAYATSPMAARLSSATPDYTPAVVRLSPGSAGAPLRARLTMPDDRFAVWKVDRSRAAKIARLASSGHKTENASTSQDALPLNTPYRKHASGRK
jgi:hypothetical protein